jgi:hypothetical protein
LNLKFKRQSQPQSLHIRSELQDSCDQFVSLLNLKHVEIIKRDQFVSLLNLKHVVKILLLKRVAASVEREIAEIIKLNKS